VPQKQDDPLKDLCQPRKSANYDSLVTEFHQAQRHQVPLHHFVVRHRPRGLGGVRIPSHFGAVVGPSVWLDLRELEYLLHVDAAWQYHELEAVDVAQQMRKTGVDLELLSQTRKQKDLDLQA